MRSFPLLSACLALALLAPAGADECVPTTSQPEVDTGSVAGTGVGIGWRLYIDNDVCQLDCLFSVWIYQESNGIDGLQRGDEAHDDTCGGMIEPDYPPDL